MLTCVGCGGATGRVRQDQDPLPERPVALILPLVGGGELSLQDLRGEPAVVAIFSTWSTRAQAEASLFVQMHEAHKARGLQVLGLALLTPGAREPLIVQTYLEVNEITFPVLMAAPDDPDLVAAVGLTKLVPRTLVLDRAGQVVLDQKGQTDFAVLNRVVGDLLKE